jgi:dipeptidyl aminopeptidase/acylaminoacyl peptidase
MRYLRPLSALFLLALLTAPRPTVAQEVPGAPSFRDVLNLKSVGSPTISPDGTMVAFTMRSTDWEENGYDTEIWLVRPGGEPFQLTRTLDGGSSSPQWSPDGRWLSFAANRGDDRQIYLIDPRGGEAWPLTEREGGIGSFLWSPDGSAIAFSASEEQTDADKKRQELYGAYAVDDGEYRLTHLWLLEVPGDGGLAGEPRRITEGEDYTVGSFRWSPDGTRIAFDHRPDPLINSWQYADISILDVDSGVIRALISEPGPQSGPVWSPDGRWILYSTPGDVDLGSAYYLNSEMAKIPATGGESVILTEAFDEDIGGVTWTPSGVFFTASQRTRRVLFGLDPDSGATRVVGDQPYIISGGSFSKDGSTFAFVGQSPTTMGEVYTARMADFKPLRLTDMTSQTREWGLGTSEVIRWRSKDRAEIEGVLFKPVNYQAGRRYPLFVVIHGGPTGTSRPQLAPGGVYPIIQWLAKGAVVLMPNYRGSAGYGEAFRSLNVRNLGVGDMWDVMSGVDYLVDEGIADPDRMGAMGWSQGGYISAFLTTNTDRFKAISVGAGISNWVTYYVNTDIHPFTIQYLKDNPWEDPKVYEKTSPMTNIRRAKTPTLIQHGEFDQRVPIPNAYELLQGLRDMDVEAKLIVYRGFGHGISKPKERLAAVWHNWIWFGRHIWGETIEMPLETEKRPPRL